MKGGFDSSYAFEGRYHSNILNLNVKNLKLLYKIGLKRFDFIVAVLIQNYIYRQL